MKVPQSFLLIILLMPFATGCSRVEKVRAIEGPKDIPYKSLGTLEIKERAHYVTPRHTFWSGVELATLTFADTPSRGDSYKKYLREKLARIARKRYRADFVINVHYWPDPESKSFPQGYIYARGEMIKYERFPGDSAQAVTAQPVA